MTEQSPEDLLWLITRKSRHIVHLKRKFQAGTASSAEAVALQKVERERAELRQQLPPLRLVHSA